VELVSKEAVGEKKEKNTRKNIISDLMATAF
jgi:hypothetical protein